VCSSDLTLLRTRFICFKRALAAREPLTSSVAGNSRTNLQGPGHPSSTRFDEFSSRISTLLVTVPISCSSTGLNALIRLHSLTTGPSLDLNSSRSEEHTSELQS